MPAKKNTPFHTPNYKSVIIFLNRRCTVGCASCSAGALPGNSGELTTQWLSCFFRKIEKTGFPKYIIWTGGEPFLSIDSLQHGISLASSANYHSEILTSGSWFDSHPGWLELLKASRNISLRISLDTEHQEKVSISLIIALIRKALELHVEVNFTLREIPGLPPSPTLYIDRIKKELPGFYRQNCNRSRWIHYIPHIPVKEINPVYRGMKTGPYRKPCSMISRDLVIGEDGMVYPCCGFFSLPVTQRKALQIGDPIKESWETLSSRQANNSLFGTLKEKGPYGICKELNIKLNIKPGSMEPGPFQNICHLCLALLDQNGERVMDYYRAINPVGVFQGTGS
jgi:hypothetical protein